MTGPKTPHPPPEIMAAVAEGALKRRELEPLLEHLEECPACRTELELVSRTFAEEAPAARPAPRVLWLGAGIAAALAIVVSLAIVQPWQERDHPLAALVELAPRSARIVEPRLSGGFAYAPYSGPSRAGDPAAEAERLKLGGQAGIAIEEASRDASADAQHAAGVAYLLVEKPDQAIAHLRNATQETPDIAAVWSDLAAAQYAAALRIPAPSLLPEALAAADRALKIDAKHAEALFNRALILERMGLTQQARTAWERYLAVDAASSWAVEARARLGALPATSGDALFRQQLPELERAAAVAGQVDGTDRTDGTNHRPMSPMSPIGPIVRRWPEQSRAWGEAEYLGRWAEAEQKGDAQDASRHLAIARALGTTLREQSGESLLVDAVAAIDRADTTTRKTIAEAHVTYRRGRIAYSRQQPAAAEPELRRAATLFAQGRSPMARMASYYAANTRFDGNDLAAAAAELEALLVNAPPSYKAADALIRWQLSRCRAADGDTMGAIELLSSAAATLRRIGERNNLGFVETMLADMYTASGRPDEAWAARIRSFEVLSTDGRGDRLPASLAGAITMERWAGHRDAAMSLLMVEREASRTLSDDSLLAVSLSRAAVLSAELGDHAGAARLVDELRASAARVDDPGLRNMIAAHTGLAEGAATLQADPRGAARRLADAARAYEQLGYPAPAIDCHLLQARAERAYEDDAAAARTIDAGLERFERFQVSLAGRAAGEGVVESGRELYAEAIRLSLDGGDTALAFGYADRMRIRYADTPPPAAHMLASEVQARLAGSGATLIETVVLQSETIVFSLDEANVTAIRQALPRNTMIALAASVAAGDRNAASAMYDLLVRSVNAVPRARTLIFAADPVLDAVPFAALYDAGRKRYLVEHAPVVLAESAASLRVMPSVPPPSNVLAIALPSGDGTASLAETGGEVSDVAASYAHATTIPRYHATFAGMAAAGRDADVIHLSGHTEETGSGMAALRFAGERVPWKTIAGASFPRLQVAVLGACNTLRVPSRIAGARAPSLGGAFLASGARAAIGTLRPVGDRDARTLFRSIHRQLGAGVPAAEAVRNAQLEAIAAGAPPGAWSAFAVLIREVRRPV